MKKIVKKFNNLVKKTIFKLQNKTTTFKLQHKVNNKFIISSFNKYLIIFIGFLFFYLFYLLIPLLYDKGWVQNSIESKFLNEFKINLSSSANVSYRILPAPHFLIKDSTILLGDTEKPKSIAEIKILKIFLYQINFFDKEKMNIKKVVISNANFSLTRNDLKILNQYSNKKFSNKKIKINSSKIFFKDNLDEVISIVKINKTTFFFDDKKLVNLFNLRGEAFTMPFTINFINQNGPIKSKEINFNIKPLKLNILNNSITEENKLISGKNVILFLNSEIRTIYDIEDKLIVFKSKNSRAQNSKFNYHGNLSINPFDLDIDINLGDNQISKLFNFNSILTELIMSEALFNDHISINSSIDAESNIKNELFQRVKINFNIINGKINFNNSKLINDKIGSLKLENSDLFIKDNNVILNTDILIDIKNINHLFSFLNTSKQSRKNVKNILINLDYNFSTNQIEFHNVEIDKNKAGNNVLSILDGFSNNNSNNLNKTRVLINKVFQLYEG